jgi:UDP-N-acetylmuramoyl-L-alanyl-D-glutamate--2,6-diaminopimelate ligase
MADVPGIMAVAGYPPRHSPAGGDIEITEIVADSRQVRPGALFVAYRGVGADGHRFIADAVGSGAVAVVGEQPPAGVDYGRAAYLQVRDGREALAWLSAAWEGHPSRRLALVGVTGTDGKTTTSNILYSILRTAGRNAGLISTVNAKIGERTHETGLHTTTPDAPEVQRYLAQMVASGTDVAILEATSHGLAQHRVTGCAFDIAVVTNVTHEHLDFHGSYEDYREAKARLFRMLASSSVKPGLAKTKVLNADDASYPYMLGIPAERTQIYGLGTRVSERPEPPAPVPCREAVGRTDAPSRGAFAELLAWDVRQDVSGLHFDLELRPEGRHWTLHSPLLGEYNVYNILAASSAAIALGAGPEDIATGVQRVTGVPGRMERIDRGQTFMAIVDFAHTPNALANVLRTARTLTQGHDGRVIVAFGSAGLRDRAKRGLMGEVAAQHADLAIVTAEDPRTEDLAGILNEIAGALRRMGRLEGRDFVQIADRQRAILYAVEQARQGDVVLVCGKGHERSMCFGAIEHPWRDQDALVWALDMLSGTAPAAPPYVLPTWGA